MARPRKSTAAKEASGSYKKDPQRRPVNEPKPENAVPPMPPRFKKKEATRDPWNALCGWLYDLGVASVTDAGIIEQYVDNYVIARLAYAEIAKHGVLIERPIVNSEGEVVGVNYVRNPACATHAAASALCMRVLTESGLSATSRSKVQTTIKQNSPAPQTRAAAWLAKQTAAD